MAEPADAKASSKGSKSSRRERKKRSNAADGLFHQSCALHRDALNGDLFSIDKLLEAKADVNEANNAGSTALHFAAQNGQVDVAMKLLFAKADPSPVNRMNETPLHLATKKGLDEVCRAFCPCTEPVSRARLRECDSHDLVRLLLCRLCTTCSETSLQWTS